MLLVKKVNEIINTVIYKVVKNDDIHNYSLSLSFSFLILQNS